MTTGGVCPCGAGSARADARFCDRCGRPLEPDPGSAEFKHVTVMFADVVHSMDIASFVGSERLREIMAALVDMCAAVIDRLGGTVDKFTGDGIMAVFGAPKSLEDHAIRACLAALAIQQQIQKLACQISASDGVDLQLRVGLNSGEVIAGGIGSTSLGYTAVGDQVGLAQRMESAAPPGGILLSMSAARLVDGVAVLAEPESVVVKGANTPISACRLLGMIDGPRPAKPRAKLAGRRWEMTLAESLLDQAIGGQGVVLNIVGLPGIGKSRLAREVTALATERGAAVYTTQCESHTADVPFHSVARLLRGAIGVCGLEPAAARLRLRERIPDGQPEDMALLDDLLGVADPDATPLRIDPDARRRRLTALLNAASLGRETPAVYVIEDVHWIDSVSESMLSELLAVIPQTNALAIVTYRPEYDGALIRTRGAQTISLAPLSRTETDGIVRELLGADPSVDIVANSICERAAGNPLFVLEMVRDLRERDVLIGSPGAHILGAKDTEVDIPPTLRATIAARIDRLAPAAKRTMAAAAVIGSRFSPEALLALDVQPRIAELISAGFIDQVRFTGRVEYLFHHPLIRAVAYETQLKADRAQLHRRLAESLQFAEPPSADQNAALIAEHYEAAGDMTAAYRWHMRAAGWATSRDVAAARLGWDRARAIADTFSPEDPDQLAQRIAPRTMLCATAYRVRPNHIAERVDELCHLCADSGDERSLAIAMTGLVMDHVYQGRAREASRLASETVALTESLGDSTLTVGLAFPALYAKIEAADYRTVLRWSENVVRIAGDDPSKGNFIFGSPLALTLTSRAIARYCLGQNGWQEDLKRSSALARQADPLTYAAVVAWSYLPAIPNGVLQADTQALKESDEALAIAQRSGNDTALSFAKVALGISLAHRPSEQERTQGLALLQEVSGIFLRDAHNLGERPLVEVYIARELARRGSRPEALSRLRAALDQLTDEEQLMGWGLPATAVWVETLLNGGTESDVASAASAIEEFAGRADCDALVLHTVWLLRLRTLLARATGDETSYRKHVHAYSATATSLGFTGHIAWSRRMMQRYRSKA